MREGDDWGVLALGVGLMLFVFIMIIGPDGGSLQSQYGLSCSGTSTTYTNSKGEEVWECDNRSATEVRRDERKARKLEKTHPPINLREVHDARQ